MAEKARQPLPWDMRVLAGKGLVEMPLTELSIFRVTVLRPNYSQSRCIKVLLYTAKREWVLLPIC